MEQNGQKLSCSICKYPLMEFATKQKYQQHMRMHTLPKDSIRVKRGDFYCKICYATIRGWKIKLTSYEMAMEHFEMHKQLLALSQKYKINFDCSFSKTEVCCPHCEVTDSIIHQRCRKYHEKPECMYKNVADFFQHFVHTHLANPPKIIKYQIEKYGRQQTVEKCSFCGYMCLYPFGTTPAKTETVCCGWWESHKYEKWWENHNDGKCMAEYELAHKNIISKENVTSFVACFVKAQTAPLNCLQIVDLEVIQNIAKFML